MFRTLAFILTAVSTAHSGVQRVTQLPCESSKARSMILMGPRQNGLPFVSLCGIMFTSVVANWLSRWYHSAPVSEIPVHVLAAFQSNAVPSARARPSLLSRAYCPGDHSSSWHGIATLYVANLARRGPAASLKRVSQRVCRCRCPVKMSV